MKRVDLFSRTTLTRAAAERVLNVAGIPIGEIADQVPTDARKLLDRVESDAPGSTARGAP